MAEVNYRLVVSKSVLAQAIQLHSSGNISGAYQALADSGDDYARLAALIVDSEPDLYEFAVRSLWQHNGPAGATDSLFHLVAARLIQQDQLPIPGGENLYNIPTSLEIEESYVAALQQY